MLPGRNAVIPPPGCNALIYKLFGQMACILLIIAGNTMQDEAIGKFDESMEILQDEDAWR